MDLVLVVAFLLLLYVIIENIKNIKIIILLLQRSRSLKGGDTLVKKLFYKKQIDYEKFFSH